MTAEQASEPAACAAAPPAPAVAPSDYVDGMERLDEFCVMVTENGDGTTSLEERLAAAFGNFNTTGDRPYRVSASIGLVRAPVSDTAGVDELLARADELMYAEKKASPDSRLAG